VVVLQEAEIPARFFIQPPPPPPKLDKAALRTALRARQAQIEAVATLEPQAKERALEPFPAIPGAMLDNGSVSLQIRRT
jgi:hypothetical protein